MATRILVVDDDASIRSIVLGYLGHAGFDTLQADDGPSAVEIGRRERPDLLVLDLMLPGLDGFGVLRALRGTPGLERLPVIMLTARVDEEDKVAGLELGADDYLAKPFNGRELVARVKAILRRAAPGAQSSPGERPVEVGRLVLDRARRRVLVEGEPVTLTKTEYSLAEILIINAGFTLTRDELLEKALGYAWEGMGRTLDSHIRNLRRKLEPEGADPSCIETAWGVGYRLREAGR